MVGETGDGRAVERLIGDTRPDLLLLDVGLPGMDGIEIARRLRAAHVPLKIIILTGNLGRDIVHRALSVGANGYVVKHEEGSELLAAIDTVLAGGQYVSANIAHAFELRKSANGNERISPREIQILRLIAEGRGNQDIAKTLHISVLTVRTHRQNLMEKLDLHNAAEITAFAIKNGIYPG